MTDGDGRRGSPRRAIDLGALPPTVDVILARGTVALTDAPSQRTAVRIRGRCAAALTITGSATISADVTIEDATLEAFFTVRGATLSARRVVVSGGQLRLDTSAESALRLAEGRLHHEGPRPLLDVRAGRGLMIASPLGAAIRLDDLDAVEVPCRVFEASGGVRVVGARHAVYRTISSPRSLALDDAFTVNDDAALHLSDVDVDTLTARSALNASPRASFSLSRWRVRSADLLLSIEKGDIVREASRRVEDGDAELLGRVKRHEEGSCAPLLERPLFVRVRVPRGTSLWSTCR